MWHDLANTQYWTLGFESPMFGTTAISVGTKLLIVDTGTSFNLLPPKDFDTVKSMVETRTGIKFMGTSYMGVCSDEQYNLLEDFSFQIDGITYTMPVQAYVAKKQDLCQLQLMKSKAFTPFWILGLNFFHGYYAIFDAENLKVGFAQSIKS